MPQKDTFHIMGGGLIGLQIIEYLSKEPSIAASIGEIILYEQSESILSAWNSKIISNIKVNNGFHGIELPRAESLASYLNAIGCQEHIITVPNHRLICIKGSEIEFTSCMSSWPLELTVGLEKALDLYLTSNASQETLIKSILEGSALGSIISSVHGRFSASINECWHLIFPWFFPSEFTFSGDDEGALFQNRVRAGLVKPKYLVPRAHIFEDLKPYILETLRSMNVKIKYLQKLSCQSIMDRFANSGNQAIWCASSYSLLESLNPDLAKKCITGCRHMNLFLYTISITSFKYWRQKFSTLPSEILYLEPLVPELNRVSFPQLLGSYKSDDATHVSIMAECLSKQREPAPDLRLRLQSCFENQFEAKVYFQGCTYGRPMFSLSSSLLSMATVEIQSFANDVGLIVPEIYYGPINMAKSAIVAKNLLSVLA